MYAQTLPLPSNRVSIVAQAPPHVKRSLLKGSRGPKGRRSGGRRRCSGGGGGGVCFGGVFGVKGGINEREGAGRGRRSAGQERHGSEAALLGAGEASEEVTMDVVLSRCSGGGVGGLCMCGRG